jgi:hypothetical protein
VGFGGTNIVVFANEIHSNGDKNSSTEIDVHGLKPDTGVSNLWILDNHIHDNGGDSVQIGNATSSEPWAHHIYVGRNVLHDDRENAVDIKRSRDIIVSDNTMYNYVESSSSGGEVTVTHNDPERVWFINNRIRNGGVGIVGTGANGYYVIGNAISDIIHSGSSYNAGSFYGTQAILTYATSNTAFVGNTIWNVDAGISFAGGGGSATDISNNIIGDLLQSSHHIGVESGSVANASFSRNNLLSGTVRIKWGGSVTSSLSSCTNCRTGDPQFVNEAARDFRVQSGSPAVSGGMSHPIYTTFRNLYGIDIARDANQVARPQGGAWDIGAYEYDTNDPTPLPPAAPANLRILP